MIHLVVLPESYFLEDASIFSRKLSSQKFGWMLICILDGLKNCYLQSNSNRKYVYVINIYLSTLDSVCILDHQLMEKYF